MKVKEIMQKPILVKPEFTKKKLLSIAKKNPHFHLFIVVDKDKKFLGDIHENDLFLMIVPNDVYEEEGIQLAFEMEKKFFSDSAKEIMRGHDVYCNQNDDVMTIAKRFTSEEVNEMPVLNKKGQVVGVITQGIILRHLKIGK